MKRERSARSLCAALARNTMSKIREILRESLQPRIGVWGLVTALGITASAGTVLGFFGQFGWVLDLFSNFRVQYFLGLGFAALVLLIPKRRKLAIFFALMAIVNVRTIAPLYFDRSAEIASSSPSLRVMLINVNSTLGEVDLVRKVIQDYDPDLVTLEEVNDKWVSELRPFMTRYPYSEIKARNDNFGIAMYSRVPFIDSAVLYIGEAAVPSLMARVSTPSGELTVVATHAPPPVNAEYSRWRNEQLENLPGVIARTGSPILLLGDLNVSPWSHHFRSLLEATGLDDSSKGRGVQPTWPTSNPVLRIPIDHVLHSPRIQIIGKVVGPSVGSDHYPVIVDFTIRPERTGTRPTMACIAASGRRDAPSTRA